MFILLPIPVRVPPGHGSRAVTEELRVVPTRILPKLHAPKVRETLVDCGDVCTPCVALKVVDLHITAGIILRTVLIVATVHCFDVAQCNDHDDQCIVSIFDVSISETLREATLKDLDAGEGFRFKVRAKNGVGFSEWSVESRVFRTNAGARLMSR